MVRLTRGILVFVLYAAEDIPNGYLLCVQTAGHWLSRRPQPWSIDSSSRDVNLWKRLSLYHRDTPADTWILLGRPGLATGLDLTFNPANRLSFEDANWRLWLTQEPSMMKIPTRSPLNHFLWYFSAPYLESLTLDRRAEVQQSDVDNSTETQHGNGDEMQQCDVVKGHEEVDGIFGMLQAAEFPKVKNNGI
ncbi:uncharacterized protein TRAVEDRAFT_50425 [Trametes versicolor FP-101664 SS1]|uniref:uncharacterized protein n=1 Tax=Trametes versicolor (strain FP-101664) TaxID=717944 RepID=UPI0004623A93|nr:uncharacterized protein TRAVEDRAFT_50425 [Trametes versicolor FP-101664 SS1]EIW55936.1 hypothetical protein TRAVEDRAFT_50425 [Trametes versicolor FP-101664 SS1]